MVHYKHPLTGTKNATSKIEWIANTVNITPIISSVSGVRGRRIGCKGQALHKGGMTASQKLQAVRRDSWFLSSDRCILIMDVYIKGPF